MKIILQRVSQASVEVNREITGEIKQGFLVLLGITHEDTEKDIDYLINKLIHLRVFSDQDGHFNQSIQEINGEVLVVSQFTLYGSVKKGRRPSFSASAPPEMAEPLYELFIKKLAETGLKTATGQFGADMKVSLTNDGPVTFMIES